MRSTRYLCVAVATVVASVLSAVVPVGAQPAQTPPRSILIKEIVVEGNRRVQDAVILGRVVTVLRKL